MINYIQRYLKHKLTLYYYSIKRLLYYGQIKNNITTSKRLSYLWPSTPNRTTLIQMLINNNQYKSYLEIGCDKNINFSQINIEKKVGVDPNKGGTFRGTSDEYFKNNKTKFDIIFIDGLHEENQVTLDIINSLSVLNEGGVVLLHDCIPQTFIEQFCPRLQPSWTGDVWKSILKVRQKKELDCATLLIDHGVSIIVKRENSMPLNKIDEKEINFDRFVDCHKEWLNCIEYNELSEWLNQENKSINNIKKLTI